VSMRLALSAVAAVALAGTAMSLRIWLREVRNPEDSERETG
jgi:hypothetical protein